jgi:hypothetical protein
MEQTFLLGVADVCPPTICDMLACAADGCSRRRTAPRTWERALRQTGAVQRTVLPSARRFASVREQRRLPDNVSGRLGEIGEFGVRHLHAERPDRGVVAFGSGGR